jgi:hypothetical protein
MKTHSLEVKRMNAKTNLWAQLKQLFVGKKSKVTIYVIGVLWVAVIMQFAVNALLKPNSNILEAFVSTNSEVSSFELNMAADYGTGYLNESDKSDLISYIGSQIGLSMDQEVTVNKYGDESEVYIDKKGKNAETLIKIVTANKVNDSGKKELNHYIIVNIKLYNNLDSLMDYRDILKSVFHDLDTTNLQTTMQLTSNYKGKLSLDTMNSIADSLVKNLDGKIAYANRVEDQFTIYAYSGLLDEYVTSMDTKINIHVAISYDATTDTTNVYLGTPVINGGY